MAGYKDPPKESRFKPGQSGNPRGRPVERKFDIARRLHEKMMQKVNIKENGVTKKLALIDVILMQLMKSAAEGDLKAQKLVLSYAFNSESQVNEDEGAHEFFVRLYNEKKKKAEAILGRRLLPGESWEGVLASARPKVELPNYMTKYNASKQSDSTPTKTPLKTGDKSE